MAQTIEEKNLADLTRILKAQGGVEPPTKEALAVFAKITLQRHREGYSEGIDVANSDWP